MLLLLLLGFEIFDVLNPFNWPKDTYPFDGQLQFRESDLKASYNAVYMEEDPAVCGK